MRENIEHPLLTAANPDGIMGLSQKGACFHDVFRQVYHHQTGQYPIQLFSHEAKACGGRDHDVSHPRRARHADSLRAGHLRGERGQRRPDRRLCRRGADGRLQPCLRRGSRQQRLQIRHGERFFGAIQHRPNRRTRKERARGHGLQLETDLSCARNQERDLSHRRRKARGSHPQSADRQRKRAQHPPLAAA